jgi:hypothetical protein
MDRKSPFGRGKAYPLEPKGLLCYDKREGLSAEKEGSIW